MSTAVLDSSLTIDVEEVLGAEAKNLLEHKAKVSKEHLHLPGPDFIDACGLALTAVRTCFATCN